jgi:hypothetical protein
MRNRRDFLESIAAAAAGAGVAARFTPGVLAQGAAGGRRQVAIGGKRIRVIDYGTDMPFPWPVNPDTILNNRLITDAQKEAILGGNLIKLLKLGGGA